MVCKDKRTQIIQAVEKLALSRRFYEITLDEVAEVAKVGKGTIYHYFKDKDDLLFDVATSGFDELCDLLQRDSNSNIGFAEKFDDMCRQLINFIANRKHLLSIMRNEAFRIYGFNEKLKDRWVCKRDKLVGVVSNVLSEGVAEGIIRCDMSTKALANLLLGMLRAYVKDLDTEPEFVQNHELLIDFFLNGACRNEPKTLLKNFAALQNIERHFDM